MWIAYIFFVAATGLMCTQLMYPVILWFLALLFRPQKISSLSDVKRSDSVSLIIPVYARDLNLLKKKLVNLSQLDYSPEHTEIIVSGDGDLPEARAIIDQCPLSVPVQYTQTGKWVGKNEALNRAVSIAKGEIIIISDVDAELAPNAIVLITSPMADSQIGGVCGTIHIVRSSRVRKGLGKIQNLYWAYERWIKKLEMKFLGSVTACSGQIFAIRRDLFPELPFDVMDDIYLALAVIKKGFRFAGAPDAIAYIPPPSKTISEELKRRPRIVSGGLSAIWKHRGLFTQKNTFFYGVCLFIHKVIRRLTPVLLIIILVSTLILAFSQPFWLVLSIMQILFYMICILACMNIVPVRFFSTLAYLFSLNIGMLIGIYEFITAKGRSKW